MDYRLIRRLEGYKPTAYKCPADVWTVGYGTTYLWKNHRAVQEGDFLTRPEAEKELSEYVQKHISPELDSMCKRFGKIPDSLYESLCSLAYNVGSSCLHSETLKAALLIKDARAIAAWFNKWIYVTKYKDGKTEKVVCQGLVNRRKEEVENFVDKIWF